MDSGKAVERPACAGFNASTGAYESTLDEGGSQDVTVDPVTGEVFVLDLNSEGRLRVAVGTVLPGLAYHTGETTPFAEFGEGTISAANSPTVSRSTTARATCTSPKTARKQGADLRTGPRAVASTEAATGVSGTAAM